VEVLKDRTNEKIYKGFSSQFDLVNCAIDKARGLILSEHEEGQGVAMKVIQELLEDTKEK